MARQVRENESMTETHDPTKARLLEAAGEEFAEKGFALARVRTICQRAGANLAAVNYHFGDKEQLYVQAVVEAYQRSMQAVPDFDEQLEPAEQLRRFIASFLSNVLAMSRTPSWQHDLMMREMLRPTGASETLVREAIRPRFQRLQAILRRVCPAADARRLDALTFSVIGQCLHYKVARAICLRLIGAEGLAALDIEYLTDHITAFCLAALGLGSPFDASGEPKRVGRQNGADPVEAKGR
jgi:AcrR family transcriptional regulator